jgi:Zn-dependent protease
MNWLYYLLYIFPVLVISVTIHEFAHCWTDDRLGDDTARRQGRITLNPLAHLDPMGTAMMILSALSGFGIGWGKPAPFNPENFPAKRRELYRAIGAVAGPFSNVIQMLAWASLGTMVWPWLVGLHPDAASALATLCYWGIIVNAGMAVFNMLPVYPLDGHHLLSFLAPRSWRPIIDNPAWGYVFLALVFIPGLYRTIVSPIIMPVRMVATWLAVHLTGSDVWLAGVD